VTEAQVGPLITQLSADAEVTEILLQLPLPPQLDVRRLIALLHPDRRRG
jgi:5,10-methylene-tetrahydrofolate dehydrogenase/methenyl tetrahydrofolate cyclohydrolase